MLRIKAALRLPSRNEKGGGVSPAAFFDLV
jgi:hypothetical protein